MGTQISLRDVFLRNLDQIREEKGLSLPEISKQVGHHRSYLGKVYREDMGVTLELLEDIAEVLDVSPQELLSDEDQ